MFSAEKKFKNKHLVPMRLALNELIGRGKFPLQYVGFAFSFYADKEDGIRGMGTALMLALDHWPDQIVLHNVTRPGGRVKMAVEVLEYLEPIKSS